MSIAYVESLWRGIKLADRLASLGYDPRGAVRPGDQLEVKPHAITVPAFSQTGTVDALLSMTMDNAPAITKMAEIAGVEPGIVMAAETAVMDLVLNGFTEQNRVKNALFAKYERVPGKDFTRRALPLRIRRRFLNGERNTC